MLRLLTASSGVVQRLVHLAARVTRPLTLGVRAIILDDANRVVLIRHSYIPGWHCPGGGVEVGETAIDALERETREECNIAVRGRPVLHGIFFNAAPSRRDHVVVYVVREFERLGPRPPDWEIVETGVFALGDLPADTSPATRARLREVETGQAPPARW